MIENGIFNFCDNEKDFMDLLHKYSFNNHNHEVFENNFSNNICQIIEKNDD